MSERRTAFGAGSEQIHRLLEDCLGKSPPQEGQTHSTSEGDLLMEYLADRCPMEEVKIDGSSTILDWIHKDLLMHSSRPLRDILKDPYAPLPVIHRIKERYKDVAHTAESKAERHAATAIYFAAIAQALVVHRACITQHTRQYIHKSLEGLSSKPWLPADLRELFCKAQEASKDTGKL